MLPWRRRLCTAASSNSGVPDEAIQLLLQTHGRIMAAPALRNVARHSSPPEPKVSVLSVLDAAQEKQPDSNRQSAPAAPAPNLASFLGTLRTVYGPSVGVQRPDNRLVQMKERIARRRPLPADQQVGKEVAEALQAAPSSSSDCFEKDGSSEHVAEEDTPLSLCFRKPVLELEDECLEYDCAAGGIEKHHATENPRLAGSNALLQMSSLVARLKNGDFSMAQEKREVIQRKELIEGHELSKRWVQVQANAERERCENYQFNIDLQVQANAGREKRSENQLGASGNIDQGTRMMFRALDLVDANGSVVKAVTLEKIVGSFSTRDMIDGSIEVFYATRHAGFLPSSAINTCLICLLLKAGRHPEARHVLGELLQEGIKLGPGVLVTLIDAFERVGELRLMYQMYMGMVCNSGFSAEPRITEQVLTALSKAGNVKDAILLSTTMTKTSGISVQCCNHFLDALCRQNRMLTAIKFLHRMRKGLCKPNLTTYNGILNNLCRTQHAMDARTMLNLMRRSRLQPDALSYHFVIYAFCKSPAKRMLRAFKYFKDMKDAGITPDTATYCCLIWGCGQRGKVKAAMELYEEMKRKDIPLDVMVFNTLIHTLSKNMKGRHALLIFGEMTYRGYKPDLWTFNVLINGLAKLGEAKLGIKMFSLLKRRDLVPDVVTYTAMLECLGNGGKAVDAFKLHRSMLSRQLECNSRTWNTLLKGLAKEDRIEMAYRGYLLMRKRGCQPDMVTYSIMLDLCTALRDLKKVRLLQRDMRAANVEPDEGMKRILERTIKFVRKETRLPYDTRVPYKYNAFEPKAASVLK